MKECGRTSTHLLLQSKLTKAGCNDHDDMENELERSFLPQVEPLISVNVSVDAAHCCSSALFSITEHSRQHSGGGHTTRSLPSLVFPDAACRNNSLRVAPVTSLSLLASTRRTATLRCEAGCEAAVRFPCPLHSTFRFPPRSDVNTSPLTNV